MCPGSWCGVVCVGFNVLVCWLIFGDASAIKAV